MSLSGSGVPLAPAVSLAPTSESFGSQLVGYHELRAADHPDQHGQYALSISSIALSGTNPGDFTQTNTCPASLAAGAQLHHHGQLRPHGHR